MASAMYERANLLAILSVGDTPEWHEQVDGGGDAEYDGPPDNSAAGVDLDGAVKTLVFVQLRREVHRRTVYIRPGTFDAATTYTAIIGGTSVGSTGASLALLLADIASDINANGTTSLLVSATVVDTDGDDVNDAVRLVGLAEADYSIDVSVAAGTGTITAEADPSSCTARLYATGAGPNAPGRLPVDPESNDPGVWLYINGQLYTVGYRGLAERFDTPGLGRLYVELDSVAGHASDGASLVSYTPHVWIGPGVESL